MANAISFSGVGSNIDFNVIRDSILAARSAPIARLQGKISDYNGRIDALRQLNGSLAGMTTAAKNLTSRDLGTGRAASLSDGGVASATADSTAALGQIDLTVTRLATTLSQASRSYASKTAPVLTGGATSATFELRKGGADAGAAITLDATNNSLEGLRDAINAANAGVKASIVDLSGDGTQQQLVLASTETGANGRVELVETTATGTADDLGLRSLNPPDGNFSKLDAAFNLNGLDLTRSSNTVSDAVTGVTLTLKKAGATTVNVTASTDIASKLQSFVTAYNAVQDFVAGQYQKDARGRPSGILAGDATLRNVRQQLRDAVGGISGSNGGSFKMLAEIGVTAGEDGKLSLDTTVLNDKLKTGSEDVRALLLGKTESDTGIFQAVHSAAASLSDATTGSVQNAITGYQDSITGINSSINTKLEMINRLRTSLTRQFSVADAAIGQINGQGTALVSIMDSLKPRER